MLTTKKITRALCMIVLIPFASGCSIGLGPERLTLGEIKKPPLLRLNKVSETASGTWTYAAVPFREVILSALRQPSASTIFTSNEKALLLDIQIDTNHEDDLPRLVGLAALSMITLGIVPQGFGSFWKLTGKAVVSKANGTVVTEFPLETTGSYGIMAYPITWFTLLGGSFRSNKDFYEIQQRCANNIASQIMAAVESNYSKLADAYDTNITEETADAPAQPATGADHPAPAANTPDLL